MIVFSILIPLADNSRVVFTAQHHMVFEEFVTLTCGAFTLEPNELTGSWRDEKTGIVYSDALRSYIVALNSIFDAHQIYGIAQFACAHYSQEAIGVRYLGLFEIVRM